jgi:outer membrane protein TolC
LNKALENSPALKEYRKNIQISKLQNEIDYAQNSGFQIALTAGYLFAPYFNDMGDLISVNPNPNAIGYDVGITNGGEYSALFNVEKNIYLGSLNDIYNYKNEIQQKQYNYDYEYEKHQLFKEITNQYLTAYKSLLIYNLSEEAVENLNKQLEVTAELVQKGFTTVQNYLELKIEKQNQQINLNENYQQYINDFYQLNALAGINDTSIVLLDSVKIEINQQQKASSFLQKYKLDSISTVNQQEIFETKYIPKLNLFFNTGLNAVEIDNIQRKFGLSAGINFSYPIFDGNQRSLTEQQNQINLEIIKNNRSYFIDRIEIQKKNSLTKINIYKQNLEQINKQFQDYQELINLSGKELREGNLSMMEYLTLFRNFIDFKKNRIDKKINYQMEINNYNFWNWQYE